MKHYYVYIMTNRSETLYIGVTNNLERRIYEHKHYLVAGFTSKYLITRLVYFEETSDVNAALAREKHIKGWLRAKKVALIESINPDWRDCFAQDDIGIQDDIGMAHFLLAAIVAGGRDPSLRSG